MTSAAIYARVSSGRQKKDQTIGSQTAALREHAAQSRLEVPEEWVFEDSGIPGRRWSVLAWRRCVTWPCRAATVLTRQQTLTATLDWSHELLDDDERTVLRRLGTFAGSCDLDAVEAVCESDLDVLGRLVDKSLVVVEEQDEVARYRLLDTVRHYARERLAQAGEQQRMEARHRAHYLRLVEELGAAIDGPEARRRLAREIDELRRGLRTALRAEPEVALRLAGALWRFWHDRGNLTEGARWLRGGAERCARAIDVARSSAPRTVGSRATHQ